MTVAVGCYAFSDDMNSIVIRVLNDKDVLFVWLWDMCCWMRDIDDDRHFHE